MESARARPIRASRSTSVSSCPDSTLPGMPIVGAMNAPSTRIRPILAAGGAYVAPNSGVPSTIRLGRMRTIAKTKIGERSISAPAPAGA